MDRLRFILLWKNRVLHATFCLILGEKYSMDLYSATFRLILQ